MATAQVKLLRPLVDYYQGGEKIYAAGNLYPESDTLLLMKSRGEAEAPRPVSETKESKAAAKAAREAQELADREAADKAAQEAQGQGGSEGGSNGTTPSQP